MKIKWNFSKYDSHNEFSYHFYFNYEMVMFNSTWWVFCFVSIKSKKNFNKSKKKLARIIIFCVFKTRIVCVQLAPIHSSMTSFHWWVVHRWISTSMSQIAMLAQMIRNVRSMSMMDMDVCMHRHRRNDRHRRRHNVDHHHSPVRHGIHRHHDGFHRQTSSSCRFLGWCTKTNDFIKYCETISSRFQSSPDWFHGELRPTHQLCCHLILSWMCTMFPCCSIVRYVRFCERSPRCLMESHSWWRTWRRRHLYHWTKQKLAGDLGKVCIKRVDGVQGESWRDRESLEKSSLDTIMSMHFGGLSCCSKTSIKNHHRLSVKGCFSKIYIFVGANLFREISCCCSGNLSRRCREFRPFSFFISFIQLLSHTKLRQSHSRIRSRCFSKFHDFFFC